jgi:UDP-N-acetylmuramoyl-L-alanyl-D-glutamate--2,6-diaminopimelate ligase
LLEFLPLLKPVKGRMNLVELGQPFEVIIDYAHTPSSFEAILPPIRERVKGRIFCLFGSGGERDREKRPRQAEVAARYCDVLILTDEDPRGEEPMELLEEIASGCPRLERGRQLFLIPDRPKAIRSAFAMAKPGDSVLLLGKGHENSIIYADHIMPYDEETEAVAALRELGYGR